MNSFTLLICFSLAGASLFIQAKEPASLPTLTIKPTKCVSLKQGEVCYVSVSVVWQVSDIGDYCLFSTLQKKPLQCWYSTKQGAFSQEVEMNDDVAYSLKKAKSGQVVVSSTLPLAWVYKKEKFSHASWRIF
ncbi:DUF3019 domain-containing protein [Flocculibacter collagenilyticus]|uniref:DUF3019 domain-containing protein n=1 Tax=Flocculibacter collagenilyticus TaxID=2744479 RepID=UPI0018F4CA3E|nr:DUF3019 domain-containing protein [Flocculibacter collagenilyticus]